MTRLALFIFAVSFVLPVSARCDDREQLASLETASHGWWHEGAKEKMRELMADDYLFVAPNGALETKAYVLGEEPGPPPALDVESLRVEVEEVVVQGDRAVVAGILHMQATVRGRPAPPRLRVLSVYERSDSSLGWQLFARSTTPVRSGPPTGGRSGPP